MRDTKKKDGASRRDGLNDPIDFTKDGECSRCGGCCSSIIPLDPEEAAVLKRYADAHGIRPEIPPGDDMVYLHCPFLEREEGGKTCRCLAYDARPAVCRTFSCHNTTEGNVRAWTAAYGNIPSPEPRNVWSVFNKTGLRLGGVEIPYAMAPMCRIGTDDGAEYQFQIGRPASFMLAGGEHIPHVMVIGLFKDGIQATDPGKGKLRFYPFEQMTEILSDSCIIKKGESDDA